MAPKKKPQPGEKTATTAPPRKRVRVSTRVKPVTNPASEVGVQLPPGLPPDADHARVEVQGGQHDQPAIQELGGNVDNRSNATVDPSSSLHLSGQTQTDDGMATAQQRTTSTPRQRSRDAISNASENISPNNRDEFFTRFTNALESSFANTFAAFRDTTRVEDNTHLLNRLSANKKLPDFSGDPLEWRNFKRAYESSTRAGAYSDDENVSRLFAALKGEAREAVSALLATGSNPKAIIEALDLQFGNTKALASKLVSEIKGLPSLMSGEISLVKFAAKLGNAITAFRALDLVGYLHSPDIMQSIDSKISSSLKYAFNKFSEDSTGPDTELEKLAAFLNREAQRASKSMFTFEAKPTTPKATGAKQRSSTITTATPATRVYAVASEHSESDSHTEKQAKNKACAVCHRANHVTANCNVLARDSVERRWIHAKRLRLCFKCLESGHSQTKCAGSNCEKCNKPHHALLHNSARHVKPQGDGTRVRALEGNQHEKQPSVNAVTMQSDTTQLNSDAITLLKIVPIQIVGPRATVNTFAFLDDGSTSTIIDAQFAAQLGLKGTKTDIQLRGLGGVSKAKAHFDKMRFVLKANDEEFVITNAIAVSNASLPIQTLPGALIRLIAKRQSLFLQPYKDAQPKLLIGQDNWRLLASREFREIAELDIAISRTPLGWAVHGPARVQKNEVMMFQTCKNLQEDETVQKVCDCDRVKCDELIREYFQIESLGVREVVRENPMHQRANDILKTTTKRLGTIWETGLLWKADDPPLIDSRETARKRLLNLEKRLDRDRALADLYYKEFQRLIDNGYARRVEGDSNGRVWYLPHFGVTSETKPGRVRIVFDAAAKTAGVSLNDQIDAGPDMIQSLPGVLMRFRQFPVAITGDIKDMYMRVQVREVDQGALRFLWRGADRRHEPETYVMTRLVFGVNASPCSAIHVKDTNARLFSKSAPEAAKSIVRNSYVDDFIVSCPTVERAKKLLRDVIKINLAANFQMHKWASNEAQVLEGIDVEANATRRDLQLCKRSDERVLGLFWDTATDEIGINVSFSRIDVALINGEKKPSKREFLRAIMSIYDPLGLLCPFTLQARITMQHVWLSRIAWDELLRDEECEKWQAWVAGIQRLSNCRIPRCITPKSGDFENAQLHVFADASLRAYAAVAYLRLQIPAGHTQVSIIMAKSRVAPIRSLSVPRLELQAALLAARLLNTIVKELDIICSKLYIWSDSQTVLRWIQSEPHTRTIFVAHRLGEIAEITENVVWRWVPTKTNPADYATRGDLENEGAKRLWFEGPSFLRNGESSWPVSTSLSNVEKKTIDNLECRKTCVYVASREIESLPFVARIFGWHGLIIHAMRIGACVDRWRKTTEKLNSLEELQRAETYLLKTIQAACFPSELKALQNNRNVSNARKIVHATPYLDKHGVLRVNGRVTRVQNANFIKDPVILDGTHPSVRLLIEHYHRRYRHAGKETVLNEIRQLYYITGLRNNLKSVIAKCIICKKRRGMPKNPIMAPLPDCRLAFKERPFTHCGVDYFGPLLVKVKRSREKRWGAIFTCLTTRAVHLEVAHSLDTSSMIMALKRFAARRGMPRFIHSDNGTNFRGACRELLDGVAAMDRQKLHQFALQNRIKGLFNPPDAPHMGGAWERLVRTVKVSLYAVLDQEIPNDEVLKTVLAEIEHTLNSRPLTHVSADPRDEEALTPNHFLLGSSSGSIQFGGCENAKNCTRQQWREAQKLADSFWARWLKEYVPTLMERRKWSVGSEAIEKNDIVLIVDLAAARNCWKRGKIVDVYPGRDGVVRTAEVRTSSGEFVRPTNKLVKLFNAE